MSKHRHKKASGGRTPDVVSGNPHVVEEAKGKERKKGGRVTKTVGLMTGGAVRPRLDRPGRKQGGGVGANKSPLSTAHRAMSGEKTG